MKYEKGDLLWVPQATMLYKGPNNPLAVKLNEKPSVAIFLDESSHSDYVTVFINGEQWTVESRYVNKLRGSKKC